MERACEKKAVRRLIGLVTRNRHRTPDTDQQFHPFTWTPRNLPLEQYYTRQTRNERMLEKTHYYRPWI